MVELVDTQDFKGGYKIHKFECTKGNLGCRTSLNGEDLTGNADVNPVPMLLSKKQMKSPNHSILANEEIRMDAEI